MAATNPLTRLARRPAKTLRRAFVPEYEDVLRQLGELHGRLDGVQGLAGELAELRSRVDGLQGRLDDLQGRNDDLQGRLHLVEDGLHEARRLNLRIAQLTDVVTELVLPLHGRDIDPSVFETLPGDTQ
ncbi:DUF6752 domain-containing protein [Geodermatophilus nigrescens]